MTYFKMRIILALLLASPYWGNVDADTGNYYEIGLVEKLT